MCPQQLTFKCGVCVGDFHLVADGGRAFLQSQAGLQLGRHGQLVADLVDVAGVQVARQGADVGACLPIVTWGNSFRQYGFAINLFWRKKLDYFMVW